MIRAFLYDHLPLLAPHLFSRRSKTQDDRVISGEFELKTGPRQQLTQRSARGMPTGNACGPNILDDFGLIQKGNPRQFREGVQRGLHGLSRNFELEDGAGLCLPRFYGDGGENERRDDGDAPECRQARTVNRIGHLCLV